jgi:hypothetical protein
LGIAFAFKFVQLLWGLYIKKIKNKKLLLNDEEQTDRQMLPTKGGDTIK